MRPDTCEKTQSEFDCELEHLLITLVTYGVPMINMGRLVLADTLSGREIL